MDFNKKGNRKFLGDDFWLKTIGIIFLVIVVALIFIDLKIYQKKRQLIFQIGDYQKQIEEIKKSSQNLKDEIANSDNQEYLEKIAYEQLNEARPGETIYSFVMPEEKPKATAEAKNFWALWIGQLSNGFNWIKSKL